MKCVMKSIYRLIKLLVRLNLFKTIYFNFTCLPFKTAVKLPFYLYGPIRVHGLRGTISINGDIKPGMFKIGYRWWDLYPEVYLPTQILISGKLVLNNNCLISGGCGIFVQGSDSTLTIGTSVTIGGGTVVKTMQEVSIGDLTCITGNCTIMDSNMHYVKNIETGMIAPRHGTIMIGTNCWINAGAVITKGTVLPNYSIVARNSFLNKDYSDCGENAFFAGNPAKLKSNSVQRIFSQRKEGELNKFFEENPCAESYHDGVGLLDERGGHAINYL